QARGRGPHRGVGADLCVGAVAGGALVLVGGRRDGTRQWHGTQSGTARLARRATHPAGGSCAPARQPSAAVAILVRMLAEQAAEAIAERTGVPRHRVAVVLGSGWQAAAAELGAPTSSVPMPDLPGFGTPTAQGHVPVLHSVPVGGNQVLVLMG